MALRLPTKVALQAPSQDQSTSKTAPERLRTEQNSLRHKPESIYFSNLHVMAFQRLWRDVVRSGVLDLAHGLPNQYTNRRADTECAAIIEK